MPCEQSRDTTATVSTLTPRMDFQVSQLQRRAVLAQSCWLCFLADGSFGGFRLFAVGIRELSDFATALAGLGCSADF